MSLERMTIDTTVLPKLIGYPDGSEVKTIMRVPRVGGPPGSADYVIVVEVPDQLSPAITGLWKKPDVCPLDCKYHRECNGACAG